MTPFAKLLDAIPEVPTTAYRNAFYASPTINTRVHNLATGNIEMWDGSAWQTIFEGVTSGAGRVIFTGATAPNGAQVGSAGDAYVQQVSATVTLLWLKQSGTGTNTGWQALSATGTGSPESVVAAPIGVTYAQTDGATGNVAWVKNSGTGNTGWRLTQTSLGLYNVRDYGAKGDGTTDDTVAIQAAVAAANAVAAGDALLGATVLLYFPALTAYRCSANLVIQAGCHVVMEAPLVYTGTAHSPAITYGATKVAGITFQRRLVLRVARATGADWTNAGDVGVKLINVQNSDVRVEHCQAFTIGLQLVGSGAGVQHNRVSLGYFSDNQYHLDLVNTNDGGIGWVNENLFLGGNFVVSNPSHPGIARYGIRLTSSTADQYNNNNVFLKPSFQLNATDAGAADCIPLVMEYGQQNSVLSARSEGNGPNFARLTNLSSENAFDLGYTSSSAVVTVDDQSTYPVTVITTRRRMKDNQPGRLVFHSGPLHTLATYADGSSAVSLPTVHVCGVQASAPPLQFVNGFTINANYIETTTSRAVGIYCSALANGEFVVRRDCEASHYGRIYVAAFNSAGTQLDGSVTPFLTGTLSNTGSWSTNQGGSVVFSDSADDVVFRIVPTAGVQYLRVMIANAPSGSLRIRTFSIYCTDQNATNTAWTGVEDVVHRGSLGTTAPTAGTWVQGRIVWNTAPSATGTLGWVCTTAGTPGTWTAFGGLGAAPLASPAFTGTPSLPTGTTGVTQSAADNSTKLATTAYVDRTPGSVTATSAAPAGTTSTTAVMMAVGGTLTPARSTRALLIISGQMANATINDGATVQLRYGTGTAPTNGTAVTGTQAGASQTATSLVAAQRSGFSIAAVVTGLTIGTAYWVDVALNAVTGGTATVTGVTVTTEEI